MLGNTVLVLRAGNHKLSKLFANFVKALEQSQFDKFYGKETDVTYAYSAFMNYINKTQKTK